MSVRSLALVSAALAFLSAPALGQFTSYTVQTATGAINPGETLLGPGCDDCTLPVTFPFPVQVGGRTFTSANVSSNGNIQFVTSATFLRACPLDAELPYSVMVFSTDLRTDGPGRGIFTRVSGAAPNRVFEIEWRAVLFLATATQVNVQARFFEAGSVIEVVFGEVPPANSIETGVSVGVAGPTQVDSVAVLCRQPSAIASGTAYRFFSAESQITFTYQGSLRGGAGPVNGPTNMIVRAFDSEQLGTQVGAASLPGVQVTDGLFTVPLSLSRRELDTGPVWLEFTVNGTTLTPRQRLTPAPLAGTAFTARSLASPTGASAVLVTSDSRVGVGTQIPGMSLQVSGPNSYYNAPALGVDSTGNWLYMHSPGSGSGPALIWNNSAPLRFGNEPNRGVGFVEHARFSPAGSLGLGTTAPESRLQVAGSVRIDTSANPDDALGLLAFGQIGDRVTTADNSDLIAFKRVNLGGDASSLRLILGDNPSVAGGDTFAIGTILNGVWGERFRFTSDGQALKVGATAWAALSDARLKHDVQPLEGTLEKMLELRGVSFLYNDPKAPGAADGRVTGLIAQEVEKVFPDWVSTVDGTYKAVAPRGFEALTVEALRELRAEKDAEIEALRQELAELRALVRSLSRQPASVP